MEQIPFKNKSEKFTCDVGGTQYTLTNRWNNVGKFWSIDLALAGTETPLINDLPLVGGVDLLAQHGFMGFGGVLACLTDGTRDYYAPPTADNLGVTSFVYFLEYDDVV